MGSRRATRRKAKARESKKNANTSTSTNPSASHQLRNPETHSSNEEGNTLASAATTPSPLVYDAEVDQGPIFSGDCQGHSDEGTHGAEEHNHPASPHPTATNPPFLFTVVSPSSTSSEHPAREPAPADKAEVEVEPTPDYLINPEDVSTFFANMDECLTKFHANPGSGVLELPTLPRTFAIEPQSTDLAIRLPDQREMFARLDRERGVDRRLRGYAVDAAGNVLGTRGEVIGDPDLVVDRDNMVGRGRPGTGHFYIPFEGIQKANLAAVARSLYIGPVVETKSDGTANFFGMPGCTASWVECEGNVGKGEDVYLDGGMGEEAGKRARDGDQVARLQERMHECLPYVRASSQRLQAVLGLRHDLSFGECDFSSLALEGWAEMLWECHQRTTVLAREAGGFPSRVLTELCFVFVFSRNFLSLSWRFDCQEIVANTPTRRLASKLTAKSSSSTARWLARSQQAPPRYPRSL